MKKMKYLLTRRFLATALAAALVFTAVPETMLRVSADEVDQTDTTEYTEEQQALLDAFDAMDLDIFAAQTLTDTLYDSEGNHVETNNAETVTNMLAWKTPSEILYDDLVMDNMELGMAEWKAATFSVSGAVDNAMSEQQAYEMILMDILDCTVMKSETLDNLYDSSLAKMPKCVTTLCDDLTLTCDVDDIQSIIDLLKDMKIEDMTDDEKELITTILGKEVKGIGVADTIFTYSETVYDVVCRLLEYDELNQYYGTTVPGLLENMKSHTDNQKLKDAINEVNAYIKSDDVREAILNTVVTVEVGTSTVASTTAGKIIDLLVAHAGLGLWVLARDFSTGIANQLYGADEIAGKIYTLKAYNDTIDAIRDTVGDERSAFLSSGSSEDAGMFLDSLSLYASGAIKSCDYAKDFAKASGKLTCPNHWLEPSRPASDLSRNATASVRIIPSSVPGCWTSSGNTGLHRLVRRSGQRLSQRVSMMPGAVRKQIWWVSP